MKLKWNLVTKGMRPHAQLQSKLEEKVAKLETHLEHFVRRDRSSATLEPR